jgi:hypothetical protein
LNYQTYILICETTGNLKYFPKILNDTPIESGYGIDYRIKDGEFEIIP